VIGFNIGSKLSLGDMDLAIEYLKSKGNIDNGIELSSFKLSKKEVPAVEEVLEVKESDTERLQRELELEKQRFIEEQEAEKARLLSQLKAERDKMEEERLKLEEFKRQERERLQREIEEEARKIEEEKRKLRELAEEKELERVRLEEVQRLEEEKRKLRELAEEKELERVRLEEVQRGREEKGEVDQAEVRVSNQQRYEGLEIEVLYKEVKKFMVGHGVGKKPVAKELLEEEFGVKNIKILIARSYLIMMRRGVTIGR